MYSVLLVDEMSVNPISSKSGMVWLFKKTGPPQKSHTMFVNFSPVIFTEEEILKSQ
jgi:hypothetical protein